MTTNDIIKSKVSRIVKENITFIIPYLGEYNLLLDLLENINKLFVHLEKQIIIIDDGSKNKDFYKSLVKLNKFLIIRHESTKGFAASVNAGLKETRTKYACVLHTDTKFFDKNSISNLIKEIKRPELQNVAILSSVSNNPLVHDDILKRKQAEDTPAFVTDKTSLPLYCALVDVRAILTVNMIPEFPYAWFEDEALCHKLIKNGYKLAVCPSSHVVHKGMGTIKNLINSDKLILDKMKNNFQLCKKLKTK